jgi:hypothetical protein
LFWCYTGFAVGIIFSKNAILVAFDAKTTSPSSGNRVLAIAAQVVTVDFIIEGFFDMFFGKIYPGYFPGETACYIPAS